MHVSGSDVSYVALHNYRSHSMENEVHQCPNWCICLGPKNQPGIVPGLTLMSLLRLMYVNG